jgi:hypothetical protein
MAQRKIQQLDKKINRLQSDLFDLYRQRQNLFSGKTDYPATLRAATATIPDTTAEAWFTFLQNEWQAREVKLPAASQLMPKIKSGLVIIQQLAHEFGVSSELFTLVFIPSSARYSKQQLTTDRLKQPHVQYADHNENTPQSADKKWRLLVVYDGIDGLELGSAEEILTSGAHEIVGLDTRALGPREYAIYALRHTRPRDHHNWTWLLRGSKKDQTVTTVSFISGAYRFMQDDAKGFGQGERFRPSVEVV